MKLKELFESYVILDGSKTVNIQSSGANPFESYVILDGSKTILLLN